MDGRKKASHDISPVHSVHLADIIIALSGHQLLCMILKLSSKYNAVILSVYLVFETCLMTNI